MSLPPFDNYALTFPLFFLPQCVETCKTITSNDEAVFDVRWSIGVTSMVKQEFLVATHLAWEPSDELVKCLVTWEVFGGGLIGNLVTDASNAELSLWPDTKYRIEVTCKNKVSKHD